jgi:hypothetical protein
MKLALFQELVDLNRAFEEVIRGLARMERVRHFQNDMIRRARAEVETARVDANREFFDNFEAMVEDGASWAYQFQREYDRKARDPFDLYLEIKEREEVRRKKGLPARVVLLPDWDKGDEERYDQARAEKKKRAARKKVGAIKRRTASPAKGKKRAQAVVAPASEGEANQ